jgi:hypothetical protein
MGARRLNDYHAGRQCHLPALRQAPGKARSLARSNVHVWTREFAMTDIKKVVRRVTIGRRRDRGKSRALVISIEPGDVVGVRMQGTRQTFRVSIEGVFEYAMRNHLAKIDKRARQIAKSEGIKMRSAMVRARKELAEDLRS